MWFEDLSPCTIFPVQAKCLAVGWLDRARPFPTGELPSNVYAALSELIENPWQPFASGGFHGCTLCRFAPEARASSNLFIPAKDSIFVCPSLIVHYLNAHWYAPPEEFCRAVLECPPMRSMEYLAAIKGLAGAGLFKPPSDQVDF